VVRERTAEWCANVTWGRGVVRMLRTLVKERGSLVVWKTPRDYVALQRDDTSVLRNYEATVSIAVRGSAFDANPGEDGILGSREISTGPANNCNNWSIVKAAHRLRSKHSGAENDRHKKVRNTRSNTTMDCTFCTHHSHSIP
jgi:hypothetical protein